MRKCWRGSVTVEAALLMPMILFLLLSFVFLGYRMYDRCRIEGAAQQNLLWQNKRMLHNTVFSTGRPCYENINAEGVLGQIFREESGEDFSTSIESAEDICFITTPEIAGFEISWHRITCEIEEPADYPAFCMQYFIRDMHVRKKTMRLHHPAEFVRGYTVLDDIISQTEGLKQMKESASKLLSKVR